MTPLESLCSALLFLLSRHAKKPQEHLPHSIRIHLNWIADHPDADKHPVLVKTCQRLAKHWSPEQAALPMPKPPHPRSYTMH